jgi:hypothetical protein
LLAGTRNGVSQYAQRTTSPRAEFGAQTVRWQSRFGQIIVTVFSFAMLAFILHPLSYRLSRRATSAPAFARWESRRQDFPP